MSFSIDVNILIYAINTDAQQHKRASNFVDSIIAKSETWAFAWPVAHSFLRIATHPAILPKPLSPKQAINVIEQIIDLPSVTMIGETLGFWDTYRRDITGFHLRGNMIPDAVLANILIANSVCTLYSSDRDFLKFKGIKIIDPLAN